MKLFFILFPIVMTCHLLNAGESDLRREFLMSRFASYSDQQLAFQLFMLNKEISLLQTEFQKLDTDFQQLKSSIAPAAPQNLRVQP